MRHTSKLASAAMVMGVLASTVASTNATAVGSSQKDLAQVRRATAQYHHVGTAIAAGYAPTEECVPGMGYHYVNFATFGLMDPLRPGALLYEPKPNGGLRLVGVEWFKVDADQNLSTDGDRPSLFGKAFDGPMPGHAPGMPIHYDLHAYLWQGNPDGVMTTWNDNVHCDVH